MLFNYLKFAWRVVIRNKFYSLLNIVGLAMGIACAIIIALYLQSELTYDQHIKNHPRIYRVASKFHINGKNDNFALSSSALAPLLADEFPEIESWARLQHLSKKLVRFEEKAFYEEELLFADSTIFDIFGYELIAGNPETALNRPNTMVISQQ